VVKTLNTMLFSVMTDPHVTKTPPVAFLSGDDDDAKALSAALLGDLGWPRDWIEDLGDITTARGPEAFMLLVPSIARNRGMVPFAMSLAV
jgi:8-hydroxy-5-deazaflavin:NADPH oxidoreductase